VAGTTEKIALCRMAIEYSEIGTEVEVGKLDGHRKRIPAQVVRFPFYDPDKTRPRSLPPIPPPQSPSPPK
jgi:aminomethyltransferase